MYYTMNTDITTEQLIITFNTNNTLINSHLKWNATALGMTVSNTMVATMSSAPAQSTVTYQALD